MSIHCVEIVQIESVEPHPNADRMEITHVHGWQCCIGKGDFKVGDKAIYIQPDYEVPLSRAPFQFLCRDSNAGDDYELIEVKRLRGVISQGLVLPVPPELAHLPVGSNVIEQLGVRRYEPPDPAIKGEMFCGGPSGLYEPKYDVQTYQQWSHLLVPGEEIVATEKLEGTSARYVWAQDKEGTWKQFAGSRTNWMKEDPENTYWKPLYSIQGKFIRHWCEDHPNIILYGEVVGQVKGFDYGWKNLLRFYAFAVLDKNRWLNYDEMAASLDGKCPCVPLLWRGPYSAEKLAELAEGKTTFEGAGHIREGTVITPIQERTHPEIGRVQLKYVSNDYLSKKKRHKAPKPAVDNLAPVG